LLHACRAILAAAAQNHAAGHYLLRTGKRNSSSQAPARIVGESASSVIDPPLIAVPDGDLVSVAAWYDNDAGYAMRLAATALSVDTSSRSS
jgi:glyceraldehyde-3-phosphate dehydrogenase/erythrose-4-phosphate dehydrogenase